MARSNLIHQTQHFIREYNLLQSGEKAIVAVSGGIDSVVLLDVLKELSIPMKLTLVVAHFNHQLRGSESDEDEAFVRNIASERGIEFYVERAATEAVAESKKLSIQEAARDLRYAFFDKLRSSGGFYKIATAHNADDNAETVLFNVFRGTGVRGLVGIPIWRKDISVIRPLLGSTREEIEAYAREKKLPYRIDSSNLRDEYTRNFLRQSIIPGLQQNVNPNLVGSLRRMGELFDELDSYLIAEAERLLAVIRVKESPEEVVLDIEQLYKQPVFMQEYLLLIVARAYTRREVDFSTVKAIVKVSRAETGTSGSLAGERVVYRDRNRLVFRPLAILNPYSHNISINKDHEFEHFTLNVHAVEKVEAMENGNIEYVDADKVGEELVIRNWSEGDWFYPLGMEGKKKLSDFFIDIKIPMYEKPSIPVLESKAGIVWVCGKRLDDRFKITPETKRLLKLQYSARDRIS